MLFQSIETHAHMQGDYDRQWIHTAVALLKAYVEDNAMDLLCGMGDKNTYVKRLVDKVVDAASRSEGGMRLSNSPRIQSHRKLHRPCVSGSAYNKCHTLA